MRQLTHGKYDDFDARYLPDGRILFLSTRRGQLIQAGSNSAMETLLQPALPDSYVRCGGDAYRPVAVYTLHTMDADGGKLCAISPFEMFEWEPSVANDGTILYSRWDYIDRDNMPYMGLWRINPDGTNARIVYKNYTHSPHCTFEPRSIPNSHKMIFTASGHHSQTMGSLVLLDPEAGNEGKDPIKRLTPEICFPEIEGWPTCFYANPWPLSERLYLVSWGEERQISQGGLRPANGMGLYLFNAETGRELLYRDPEISCMYPLPTPARPTPPALANNVDWNGAQEGRFLLSDVYQGLKIERGQIKALRIIAVPAKTQPWMNNPSLGITSDDPGKCVLGTVPVEADGSAYFRVPSGVIMFFQALDEHGMAVQSMKSVAYVQPGQTLSCIGCHETRTSAVSASRPLALSREPSRIAAGPSGSWPLRFDRLIQPVLDRKCVVCHNPAKPQPGSEKAVRLDLTSGKAYETLIHYGKPSLADQVHAGYSRGYSVEGGGVASNSVALAKILASGNVKLDAEERERFVVWMDCYAQRLGSFSDDQERKLEEFRQSCAALIMNRDAK